MRKTGWAILGLVLASACAPPKAQDLWTGRKPGHWQLTTHNPATGDSVVDQCIPAQIDAQLDVPVSFPAGCTGPINFDLRDRRWVFDITCPAGSKVPEFRGTVSGNFQDSYVIDVVAGDPDGPAGSTVERTTRAVWIGETCDPG